MVSSTNFARLSEKAGLSNVILFQGGASRSLNMNGQQKGSEGNETLCTLQAFSAEEKLESKDRPFLRITFVFQMRI